MQDAQALLEELRNTDDIKKTIKILKKLKLNELSPNILMKIRNIISGKNYVYYKKRLTDDGSGIVIACVVLLIVGPLMTGLGLAAAYVFSSIDILLISILGGLLCAIGSKILMDSFETELKNEPSKKQKDFLIEYQKLLEKVIAKPTKIKEKTTNTNEETILDLVNIVIKARLMITTKCSEKNKDKYNARLENLIKAYKEKVAYIDKFLQDTPSFANDYKSIIFKELESNIEQLLEDINSLENNEEQKLENLVSALNEILSIEDLSKKITQFIKLSNKICIEKESADVALNILCVKTIAEYYLALIKQNNNINLRWFLPQLNPIYYDEILNLLLTKLNVGCNKDNIDESTKLQNIESLSSIYINETNNKGLAISL